jgi:hypothetical protein
MVTAFAGPFWWTRFLFALIALIVIANAVIILFTIAYQTFIYKRLIWSKTSRTFNPSCAVICPARDW